MPLTLSANLLFRAFLETQVADDFQEKDVYFDVDDREDALASVQWYMDDLLIELCEHDNPLSVLHCARESLRDAHDRVEGAIHAFERYVWFARLVTEKAGEQKPRVRIRAATA